jgi:hypothetical protein
VRGTCFRSLGPSWASQSKPLDLRGNLYRRIRNVKGTRSAARRSDPFWSPVQNAARPDPDGRDTPEAGDDDAAQMFELTQHADVKGINCLGEQRIASPCQQ